MFGEITGNGMELNNAGRMVDLVWNEIPMYYPNILIDTFMIMPNHVHGIIIINSSINVGVPPRRDACPQDSGPIDGQSQGVAPTNNKLSLPDIVHRYKSLTTHQYINGVKQNNWEQFNDNLWQRNYYEHVIRNDIDLTETREYIINNPKKWHLDEYNPEIPVTQRIVNNV